MHPYISAARGAGHTVQGVAPEDSRGGIFKIVNAAGVVCNLVSQENVYPILFGCVVSFIAAHVCTAAKLDAKRSFATESRTFLSA